MLSGQIPLSLLTPLHSLPSSRSPHHRVRRRLLTLYYFLRSPPPSFSPWRVSTRPPWSVPTRGCSIAVECHWVLIVCDPYRVAESILPERTSHNTSREPEPYASNLPSGLMARPPQSSSFDQRRLRLHRPADHASSPDPRPRCSMHRQGDHRLENGDDRQGNEVAVHRERHPEGSSRTSTRPLSNLYSRPWDSKPRAILAASFATCSGTPWPAPFNTIVLLPFDGFQMEIPARRGDTISVPSCHSIPPGPRHSQGFGGSPGGIQTRGSRKYGASTASSSSPANVRAISFRDSAYGRPTPMLSLASSDPIGSTTDHVGGQLSHLAKRRRHDQAMHFELHFRLAGSRPSSAETVRDSAKG